MCIRDRYGNAVKRQPLQEVDDRLLEAAELVAVGFPMIGVGIGPDRNDRRQE